MVRAMRANHPPPLTPAAARRAPPLAALTLMAALVLAGCSSVPLPPMEPMYPAPPPGAPLPQPEVITEPAPPPQTAPVAPEDAPPVRDPQLAAFSTRLDGRNQVPPVHSMGTGTMDAVLDRNSGLFRWRISYANLSGLVTGMHIHGPADVGGTAPQLITFNPPFESPWEGRLNLTPAQRDELLNGRWYIDIHTARHPNGELRGQLVERR